MYRGLMLNREIATTEKRLATTHQKLIDLVESANASFEDSKVDTRLLEALKTQQAAWLNYRDFECELIGSLTGAGATWKSTYAGECVRNLTDQRLIRVRHAMRCIRRMPEEKRVFDQQSCLQQLAPLVNG
jgi:uncharacterized protein YecT (DUF1311 family)